MNHRIRELVRAAKADGPRLGIVSMYDVENNAVRILAATLRAAGHHVTEIYFKDWISNHIFPATDGELDALAKLVRDQGLNMVCVSIRASAYYNAARILTRHLHESTDIAVLWGGMHPTLMPDECIEDADLVLKGEGELALLDLCDRLRDGRDITDTANVWLRMEDGTVKQNALRPLVTDLDSLEYRDYTSHDDKFLIFGGNVIQGDPMHGDPVFQMMGSRGCIYKCSYCYNSTYKKDVYPGQKWFRVRSPASMVDEIKHATSHWDVKRVRFDDEVFNFQKAWLDDFCKVYPREVGLPFEIFIEPKLVSEERMTMLRDAGLVSVYMGIQSSERVTGHLYDRRVKNTTINDIAELYHKLGIKPHFQLIFDDPVSTEADKKALFEMVSKFPKPFDLYLFSMTVFPGSELNHKLIRSGIISEYDIEGVNTRVFYQHRVNLRYPRPVEDTFWISLIQMLSKDFVPVGALRALSRSDTLRKHPWPLIQAANFANFVKMGTTVSKMAVEGELTKTLWRRWANMDTIITT
ncbi:MAG: cobalamin B12-binding domain-containing protein [Alphaproteobacteria bacterium]|nr:cobalamin B12-binding domain-containing protein [Alphaproteobacteria bacterium]